MKSKYRIFGFYGYVYILETHLLLQLEYYYKYQLGDKVMLGGEEHNLE